MKGLKTGGRSKGTPNKITQEIREALSLIVQKEIEAIAPQLKDLPTKERFDFVSKFLPFVIPRLESSPIGVGEIDERKQPPQIVFVGTNTYTKD